MRRRELAVVAVDGWDVTGRDQAFTIHNASNSSRDGATGSYSRMPRSGAIGNIEIVQVIRDAGCEPDLIDGLGEAPVLRYPAQLAIADALRQ